MHYKYTRLTEFVGKLSHWKTCTNMRRNVGEMWPLFSFLLILIISSCKYQKMGKHNNATL